MTLARENPADTDAPHEWDGLQRRTMTTLRLGQVPTQAAVAGVVAVVGLLAKDMLGSDRLAGSGSAAMTFGSALLAVPVSAYMRRRGRRRGLAAALAIGFVGASVAATAGQLRWFWLFLIGMAGLGGAQLASLQARYVAADLAPAHHRARAIAGIVWVGTLGAIFGPVLTPEEKEVGEWLGLDPLVGPYLFAAAFLVVAFVVVMTRLRPDPLEINGQIDPSAARVNPLRQVKASLRVVGARPLARLGLAAMVISQAVMVAVMTMTAPHMKDHGHGDLSAYVIALHIVGMYFFAPWIGMFVERVGHIRAVMVGAVVMGLGTVTAVVAGYVPALIFVGLWLLGLGWNVGLIAGSAILTTAVPEVSRVEVQGTADLTMSFCGGVAAFSSGFIKAAWGYHLLADAATVVSGLLLVLAYTQFLRSRRRPVLA